MCDDAVIAEVRDAAVAAPARLNKHVSSGGNAEAVSFSLDWFGKMDERGACVGLSLTLNCLINR